MVIERTDNIGFGDLKLIQAPEEFCYGVDAVLLADFAAGSKPDTAVDLGTGTGIVPLILSHKTKARKIIGLEVQEKSYDRACRNVILNDLTSRLTMLRGDVNDISKTELRKLILSQSETSEGVDLVTANPPYMKGDGSLFSANSAKDIARRETTADLHAFVRGAARLLKSRGHFYMVHRPMRLVDIFCAMRDCNIEPKEIRMVAPKFGEEPNIVLIHGVLNGGPELKVLDTLFVHDANGGYTEEINKIYERE